MTPSIKTISLPMPFKLGTVNCYLVKTDTGFILIDTGAKNQRAELEKELVSAGCRSGKLNLIILTHGDFDHTGNAAYLRDTFGVKLAMHRDDIGMAERGDMFWNRDSGGLLAKMIKPLAASLFGFGKSQRFTPDLFIEDGFAFSEFGFEAKALALPGHSKGSIGVLTAENDLFCGDLLENLEKPKLNSLMDNPMAGRASLEILKSLSVQTIYPGHGEPFKAIHHQLSASDG